MNTRSRWLAYLSLAAVYCSAAVGILAVHSEFQQRPVLREFIGWSVVLAVVATATSWLFQVAESSPGELLPTKILYSASKSAVVTFVVMSTASAILARPLPRQVTVGFAALQPVFALVTLWPLRVASKRIKEERVIVVGTLSDVEQLQRELARQSPPQATIVAHVNGFSSGGDHPLPTADWLDLPRERFVDKALALDPDIVIVDFRCFDDDEVLAQVTALHAAGVRVRTFIDYYEQKFGKVPLNAINEAWFLFDSGEIHRATYMRIKQAIDVAGGILGTIVFLLILPVVAAAIKLDDRGPIFYRQTRVGKDGKLFTLLKFRTMYKDAESEGPKWAQPGDTRITRVGRILRRARIDELPQFLNVLKGEMSLVGPRAERPEFVRQLEEKIPFYSRRNLMKPGLTGWAQVNYEYGSSVEHAIEKLQYEFYYMKYQSVFLDLSILLNTLRVILAMRGV